MILAFICLLVLVCIAPDSQSLASSLCQGWALWDHHGCFLSLFVLLPPLGQEWITSVEIREFPSDLSLKMILFFLMD